MTTNPKPLNKVELWIADHAVPIFAVLTVGIVIGAGVVFLTLREQEKTQNQVNVLRPQVTKINQAICDKRSLKNDTKALRCAERIRVGLINCRHVSRCRAAFLALLTYPPPAQGVSEPSSGSAGDTGGGDAPQQPSNHGHQHPGPGKGPGKPAAPSPSPSVPSPAPEKPGNGPPVDTPGKGPPANAGGPTSGLGVEVCIDPLNTCVGIGAGAKGLLP